MIIILNSYFLYNFASHYRENLLENKKKDLNYRVHIDILVINHIFNIFLIYDDFLSFYLYMERIMSNSSKSNLRRTILLCWKMVELVWVGIEYFKAWSWILSLRRIHSGTFEYKD